MPWPMLAPLSLLLAAGPLPEERRFMVTDYDRVRIEGPFQVEIASGSPGATASGDAKSLERVAIRVAGSTLVISAGTLGWEQRGKGAPTVPRIKLSARALRGLSINGGARVQIAEMRADRIELGLNGTGSIAVAALRANDLAVVLIGSGAITLAGAVVNARIRSNGAGSVAAEGLTANDAVLLAESSGDLAIGVRYTAQVNAQGSGSVTVLGAPKCRVTGPGPVTCANR